MQTRMSAFDVLTPPNPEYHPLVSRISVPILLVIGDVGAGAIVSIATARELQILNPRVQVEQIPDAGHGVPYDDPERLAAVIKSFLQTVAAR